MAPIVPHVLTPHWVHRLYGMAFSLLALRIPLESPTRYLPRKEAGYNEFLIVYLTDLGVSSNLVHLHAAPCKLQVHIYPGLLVAFKRKAGDHPRFC